MWSALVFLAGVIFLMKASIDMRRDEQARRRQQMMAARRNAANRRRPAASKPQNRRSGNVRRQSVVGYDYGMAGRQICRAPQNRTPIRRAPRTVLTA